MDWLLEIEEQRVSWQTADLLNLEVDLMFFDTTFHVAAGCPESPGRGTPARAR
jgi:hypothetical protein